MFLSRKNFRNRGFVLFFLVLSTCFYGQTTNFINYTLDDGLPSNEVHCSYQLQDGNMLFGTDAGVVRFNGNSFKSIPFVEARKLGSTIFKFMESPSGRLYLSTYRSGLFYLDGDSIRPYKYNDQLREILGQSFISNFFFTENEELIFNLFKTIDYRIYQIDTNGRLSLRQPTGVYDEFSKRTRKYLFTVNDSTAISKSTGLEKHKTFAQRRHPQIFDNKHKINKNLIVDDANFQFLDLPEEEFNFDFKKAQPELAINHNNIWWVSYNSKLAIFDRAFKLISSCDIGFKIQHLLAYEGRSIILSHENGASLLKFKNGSLEIENIIENEFITSSLKDHESGLWFTTPKSGVYYTPTIKIKNFNKPPFANQDIIQFETNPSEFVITNREFAFGFYSFPDLELQYRLDSFKPSSFYILNEGYLQMTNLRMFFDSDFKMRIEKFRMAGSNDFFQIPNTDTILLATPKFGIHVLIKGRVQNAEELNIYDIALKTYAVHVMDKTIYVATDNGIQIFSLANIGYTPYFPEQINSRIQDINSIGNKLIASSNEGVFICEKDSIRLLTNKDGLVSNICRRIEVENDSTFWVANKFGLNKIIYHSKSGEYQIFTFTKDDGLNSNAINDLSIEGENIFIATNKGMCFAKISDLEINRSPIPFEINIPSLNINGFDFSDSLYLPKEKRDIYLLIKELSFRHNENLSYSFILNNDDKNPVISSNNSISYGNLRPGYNSITLNIASANSIWNTKPITLHIWATPFFYEELWFQVIGISFLIVLISTIVFFGFKIRVRRQRQQLDMAIANQEATVSKYNALSLQLSPHFIFNSLNNIQYLSVSQNYVAVNRFVSNLARLTRKILEHSKLQLIPLETEIENLKLYLEIEQIRFEHKPIDIRFEFDPKLNLEKLTIPPMIIQPSVENAIWHGLLNKDGPRKLEILFKKLKKGFEIQIIDNGIGLNTKQKGVVKIKGQTSIGVKNTRDRIQLYNEMNLGFAEYSLKELRENDLVLGTQAVFKFEKK